MHIKTSATVFTLMLSLGLASAAYAQDTGAGAAGTEKNGAAAPTSGNTPSSGYGSSKTPVDTDSMAGPNTGSMKGPNSDQSGAPQTKEAPANR